MLLLHLHKKRQKDVLWDQIRRKQILLFLHLCLGVATLSLTSLHVTFWQFITTSNPTMVWEIWRFSYLKSLQEITHNDIHWFIQAFVHIVSLGPCLPSALILFTLHLKIKLFKIDSNKNLVLSVPHFLILKAHNDPRWWANLGTHAF